MMKIEGHDTEIVHFFALSLDKQKEYAEKISQITFAEPNMLNISAEEVLDKNYIAMMRDENESVLAFAAVSKPEENQDGWLFGEIGMMYTVPQLRKHGIGHQMLEFVEKWVRSSKDFDGLVAFLCDASIKLIAEAGYEPDNGVVPKYYFDLCQTHCKLCEGAEERAGNFVEMIEIAQGRREKRDDFERMVSRFSSLDDEVSLRALDILEGNRHRAGLCCPLPVYKFLQ